MEKSLLGYCVLNCEDCPVFIATVNNDDRLRISTAREWSVLYSDYLGKDGLKPEDMNCAGCRFGEGAIFIGCTRCPIRKCCREKELNTCALCSEYDSCEMLNGFFSVHPHAKANLDRIRIE